MGLSFLNKKSWHPGSFQNIEKVWLAEQKQKDLAKKDQERLKKLKEERHVEELKKFQVQAGLIPASALDRMDWIYEWGNKVQDKSKEEYLLGKPVDQSVTKDKKPQFTPLFKESTANSQNEAFTKLHEDPMFFIRQEELKRKKEIIENPMKMKDIYKEIEKLTKGEKKKKKHHKKDKSKPKEEKKHKMEEEVVHKKPIHHENGKDRETDRHVKRRHSPSSSRSSSAPPRKRKDSSSRSRSRSHSNSRHHRHHNRDHSHSRSQKPKHRHHNRSASTSRSSSAPRRRHRDSSSKSRSRSKSKEKHQKKVEEKQVVEEKNPQMFDEYMKKRLGPYVTFSQTAEGYKPDFNINRRNKPNDKKKLTDEEKLQKLDEMKQNAVTLAESKVEQVKRDRVEEDNRGAKNYLSEMRKDVYSKPENFADLGDRVSRNVHYLARNLDEKNTFKR
jgi:hypothetical protein